MLDLDDERQRALAAEPYAPQLLVPPASMTNLGSASAVWFTAFAAIFNRFPVLVPGMYRYVNVRLGSVASGNLQVGVVKLSYTAGNASPSFKRVMNSGLFAYPTTNIDDRVDCGATLLTPGEYAAFLYCDNTTATLYHSAIAGVTAAHTSFAATFDAAGVPASGVTNLINTTRSATGLTVEQATY